MHLHALAQSAHLHSLYTSRLLDAEFRIWDNAEYRIDVEAAAACGYSQMPQSLAMPMNSFVIMFLSGESDSKFYTISLVFCMFLMYLYLFTRKKNHVLVNHKAQTNR